MIVEFASGLLIPIFICLMVSPFQRLPESSGSSSSSPSSLGLRVSAPAPPPPRDQTAAARSRRGGGDVETPMQLFEGQDWRTAATKSSKTLASNRYGQFQIHSVLTEQGTLAENWLWTNDRDQVNVVALMKDGESIMLSKEHRYGLWNSSISALNGYIHINESSQDSARRVLRQHGGIAADMQPLGKYRVQVNRGGGFLHIYLARGCSFRSLKSDRSTVVQYLRVSRTELIGLLSSGAVLEAQWAASLALALVALDTPHRNH